MSKLDMSAEASARRAAALAGQVMDLLGPQIEETGDPYEVTLALVISLGTVVESALEHCRTSGFPDPMNATGQLVGVHAALDGFETMLIKCLIGRERMQGLSIAQVAELMRQAMEKRMARARTHVDDERVLEELVERAQKRGLN